MDIKLRQLEIFHAVVIAGSITRATGRVGLSQPSISQQLAKLEETLEVQLIERNRSGSISLTPAGEFWFKHTERLIGHLEATVNEHEQRFRNANIVLRIGVTPALRGRFVVSAAQIAMQVPGFVKLEVVYDLNSMALIEQLRMHKVNFVIVADSALIGTDNSACVKETIFTDDIYWAVPAALPESAVRAALLPGADQRGLEPALRRYVEIDPAVPTRPESDAWYRHVLPHAMPVFAAPTFAMSAEFVAAGLATCHLPGLTLPSLAPSVRERMRLYRIDGMTRRVVLVMRKHLLTHPTYARIFRGIVDFARADYVTEIQHGDIPPLSELLPQEA